MKFAFILPLRRELLTTRSGEVGVLAKKRINRLTRIPDAVVLEIRRRHELEHWPMHRLFAAYPTLKKQWIRRVLNYELRANLWVQPRQ